MLSQNSQLSVAYLVINPLIAIPSLYILFRHGKYGILGWAYLIAFCILRMTGAGLQLSQPSSTVAATLTAVGLSPLILSVLGVLHETSLYISDWKPWPLRIPFYIGMHFAVAVAVALLASGKHSAGSTSGTGKVGAILFLVIWVVMVGLSMLSNNHPKRNDDARLLHLGVSLALIFIGVRVIYTVVSSFIFSINPYSGKIVYRVVFGAVMEYITAVILLVFGLITRNIRNDQDVREENVGTSLPLKESKHGKRARRSGDHQAR